MTTTSKPTQPPVEVLIASIEAANHVLTAATKAKAEADHKLRTSLLATLRGNDLGYGIVSRRMGRDVNILINYFNGQSIKSAYLMELIEAVKNPPTEAELASTKKRPGRNRTVTKVSPAPNRSFHHVEKCR